MRRRDKDDNQKHNRSTSPWVIMEAWFIGLIFYAPMLLHILSGF